MMFPTIWVQRPKKRVVFGIALIAILELSIYPNDFLAMLRSVIKIGLFVLSWASPAKKGSVYGPLIRQNFADPAFIEANGTYYAFSTQYGIGIPVATSKDFKFWTVSQEPALAKVGAWSNGRNLWAPDVKKIKDLYVMYYTALPRNGSRHCIGTATSSAPAGPYKAQKTSLLCNDLAGGAIDPFGYVDEDGTVWLVYKVDGNSLGHGGSCRNMVTPQVPTPIMVQRLSADGLALDGAAPVQILDRTDDDGPLVEAPAILRVPNGKSSTYFLFFSSHCYSSEEYDTSYAVSHTGLLGPYFRANKKDSPFLRTGCPDSNLRGPGGLSVGLTGDDKVVFHSDHGHNASHRLMWTGSLDIDARQGIVNFA